MHRNPIPLNPGAILRPMLLTMLVAGGPGVSALTAQTAQPEPYRRWRLRDVPNPPDEFRRLIRAGDVTFASGAEGRPDRETPAGMAGNQRLLAETIYHLKYRYRGRARWRLNSQRREVSIDVTYSGIKIISDHTIWFRYRPDDEGFWSDPLVLHEFDHVRISTDPRLERRFRELLLSQTRLTMPAPPGRITQAVIDRLIDQRVAETFARISELVAIRYRELDRITANGTRPLPSGTTLEELLRATPDDGERESSSP